MVYIRTLLVSLLASAVALAQVDRATVTGTLLDPSGSVVSGGKVTVTYPETSLSRSVTSNAAGAYLINGLPVGHVLVDAQKTGFRTVRTEIPRTRWLPKQIW
jgi:hypothetical protein